MGLGRDGASALKVKVKEDKLELSMTDSVISPKLKELSKDVSEIALDSTLDNGLLKDIPVIKWIHSFYKMNVGIRERLFIKKVLRFFLELREVPAEERDVFISDLETKGEYRQKVGETLIMIIERIDDINLCACRVGFAHLLK